MSKYSPSDCQCLRWTVLVVSPQNSLKHTIQQLTWTSWDLHFHHPEIIMYHQEPWRTYTKVKHDSQCCSFSVGFWLKWIRFWVSVSEEVIIIVHHQVWHWPNIGWTRVWYWWRQWLTSDVFRSFWNASTQQVRVWTGVLVMYLTWKQLCLLMQHCCVKSQFKSTNA